MASERKLAANRRNAQKSTGPRNTNRTRSNALKHGILSSEALIRNGEGREDPKQLEEFGTKLREDLNPVGELEELLTDMIVTSAWRMRRPIRFENAAIRMRADTATDDWEKHAREMESLSSGLPAYVNWEHTSELEDSVEELKHDLDALDSDDPMAIRPELWARVFSVAEKILGVSVDNVLGLDDDWDSYEDFSKEDVARVIAAASSAAEHLGGDFWKVVRVMVEIEHGQVKSKWEKRRLALERNRMLTSLPDEKSLEKVGRYEAHLSRQFFKTLHELQRLQGARLDRSGTTPFALDIAVESN